ncbi:MAG: thiol:disulfide interchange protein DsbA/DsbL [Thiohalocapsa sp.]|uniref:thiol:disulfide interchange protein DsbA/DsbL n=1 Tax=Thiohalocapsa sp. TaxID=2497641 RepID=UPI0025DE951E|nr:thiol:disulfide interchange protein DsbA/DsbL [Thiohalocapsa sp.]MCG6942551.1 thiol:disulfide interchange protein DsbA/DsbL [Thiohalocapsa sp.]
MTVHEQSRRRPQPWAVLACLALLLLAVAGSAAAAPTAPAEEFDEGIDYSLVSDPVRAEAGDDVEVLEFFWYGCPHCFHLEPEMQRWLEHKPADVTFHRVPAAADPRWVPHAKAFYAAQQLGVLDKLHEPLFKAMHEQRRKILTEEQIIAFAAEQGIDEDAFRAAYNSFPVDMQVRKAAELVQRYNLEGVPTMVVNGKYVTSATQTGSVARMFEVVDYLVAQEEGAGGAETQPADAAPAEPQPAAAKPAGGKPAEEGPAAGAK